MPASSRLAIALASAFLVVASVAFSASTTRRLRRSTQRDPWSRLLAAARRAARHGERRCDHLHDTVSRYDHAAKRLELLLTCPVCETEKVIHSLAYEPRFEPSVASVRALHARDGACDSPIAAAEIPIDRTAHGAISC